MNIKDFQFERSVFEFRYSQSYLHWDRAGVLWHAALSKWPKLKRTRGEPNITSFMLENDYEISVMVDKTNIICYYPKSNLADFIEKAHYFLGSVTRQLEIEQFTRVGLRMFYFKSYPDEQSASADMLGAKLLNLPDGPHFGLDGSFTYPELAARWEGRAAGVTVRLRSEGRKIDFDPPHGIGELQSVHEEKFGLVCDLDYYTKGTVTTGQFRTQDWINQVLHLIRRDSHKFLGG